MVTLSATFINLDGETGFAVSTKEHTRSEAIGAYLESLKGEVQAFSIREGLVKFRPYRRPSGWIEVRRRNNQVYSAWLFESKNGPNS